MKNLVIQNQIKKAMQNLTLPLETDITVTYSYGKDSDKIFTLNIPEKEGTNYYRILDVIYGYYLYLKEIDKKRNIEEILISESQTIYVPWNGYLVQFLNREQAILYFSKCLIAIQENKEHPYKAKINQIKYILKKLKTSSDKVIYPDITDEALLFNEVVDWSDKVGFILDDQCPKKMSINEYWNMVMERWIGYGK